MIQHFRVHNMPLADHHLLSMYCSSYSNTMSVTLNSCQTRSFGSAKQYPSLKSRTITLGDAHLTHKPCYSLGAPIRYSFMIELTSTLLKLVGSPKPDRCGRGCNLSPVWVWLRAGLGDCRGCSRWTCFCQTRPIAIPRSRGLALNVMTLPLHGFSLSSEMSSPIGVGFIGFNLCVMEGLFGGSTHFVRKPCFKVFRKIIGRYCWRGCFFKPQIF
jgi:hypothetical protein